LDKDEYKDIEIYPSEVSIIYTRDSGPGGQHRNTTDSCVIITHNATGITAKQAEKDQHKNKRKAMDEITRKVNNFYRTGHVGEEVEERREQIGAGVRGDKRRTYKVNQDLIIDHVTGNSCSFKRFMKGNLELLF